MKLCTTIPFILISLAGLTAASSLLSAQAATSNSDKSTVAEEAYELHYVEREPAVDDVETRLLITDRFIRIDQVDDKSGYIIYDDNEHTVYSISHFDKTVLVIREYEFKATDNPVKFDVEYLQLSDAPKVSGNDVYNYRAFVGKGDDEETCMDMQLVENLLPDVRKILKNFQRVVSGQQVRMTDNQVTEIQTPCYFVDQVYNGGAYYDKGLPIQEWHSNERARILVSFDMTKITRGSFVIPEKYKRYSVDRDSKIKLQ
jgi:hypothetical protein